MSDLTTALTEALARSMHAAEREASGARLDWDALPPMSRHYWLEAAVGHAAALIPLVEARVREAYREGLRHGSDELDPEEFGDA